MGSFICAVMLIALTVPSTRALALPAVSMHWDTCVGPINKSFAGPGSADIDESVQGQGQVAQAYQVVVVVGFGYPPLPDAWRFDAAGCEGSSRFTINHLAPAAVAATCPSFQGALASLQIKDFSFDAVTQKGRITLVDSYPNADPVTGVHRGNPDAVNPAQRYFLGDDRFDLSAASIGPTPADQSTCGGLDGQVCFSILTASWLDLNDNEVQWPVAQSFLNTNDPANNTHCPGVLPAVPKTWGSVKGQYRN